MNEDEKAKDIVDKFDAVTTDFELAKECAVIAAEEIIEAIGQCSVVAGYPLDYWYVVKEKIKQL